jgi:hypothetical protein
VQVGGSRHDALLEGEDLGVHWVHGGADPVVLRLAERGDPGAVLDHVGAGEPGGVGRREGLAQPRQVRRVAGGVLGLRLRRRSVAVPSGCGSIQLLSLPGMLTATQVTGPGV